MNDFGEQFRDAQVRKAVHEYQVESAKPPRERVWWTAFVVIVGGIILSKAAVTIWAAMARLAR